MSKSFLTALLLLALLALPGSSRAGDGPLLEFLYIDGTVDEAAGGHAGLRLGEWVFHFQYHPDNLLLLTRDTWDDFRFLYNDLDNRSITALRLPVGEEPFRRLVAGAHALLARQESELGGVAGLEADRDLLRRLAAGDARVAVPGLGLFDGQGPEDHRARELRLLVEGRLGAGWLGRRLAEVDAALASFPSPAAEGSAALGIWGTRLGELLAEREALLVLDRSLPLAGDAVLTTAGGGSPSPEEAAALDGLRRRMADAVVGLLGSSRPDRGRAVLLEAARWQALGRSADAGRLLTLDPFPDGAEEASRAEFEEEGASLDALVADAAVAAAAARRLFVETRGNPEEAYNGMEAAQGRLHDLEKLRGGAAVARFAEGRLVPARGRFLDAGRRGSAGDLAAAAGRADREAGLRRKEVRRLFGYNLFTRNCVTEIDRLVEESLGGEEGVRAALEGYHRPGEDGAYTPSVWAADLGAAYPAGEVVFLPSFRRRQAACLAERQGFAAGLREGNTLTSTIYTPDRERDTVFLFFTDGTVAARPLLGALNLAYAAVNAVAGLAAAPADNGRHLVRSLRGMLYSLPELFFGNIRKGSFRVLPEDRCVAAPPAGVAGGPAPAR